MKRSTLNAIMTGVIICLVIAIGVVTIRLAGRGKIEEDPNQKFYESSVEASEPESESEEESEQQVLQVMDRVRITGDNINVRSGPGTDYDRLGSAYRGYDFELLDQSNEQWVKIRYDGKDAYVYREYVEIIPMVEKEDGFFEEYVTFE